MSILICLKLEYNVVRECFFLDDLWINVFDFVVKDWVVMWVNL